MNVRFLHSSDRALTVEFGNEISEAINHEIRAFVLLVDKEKIHGVTEVVPTYRSVMVHYEPFKIYHTELRARLEEILKRTYDMHLPESKVIEVPVLYGGEYGPDLGFVAKNANMSESEVIRIHSKRHYLIYMLGFTPGFAYLGGLDKRIHTPRLKVPRTKIWAGSVGIADKQTGIYPIESPGGWQIIGRTPFELFEPYKERRFLFEAGQRIKFVPIDEKQFKRVREEEGRND